MNHFVQVKYEHILYDSCWIIKIQPYFPTSHFISLKYVRIFGKHNAFIKYAACRMPKWLSDGLLRVDGSLTEVKIAFRSAAEGPN